MDHNGLRDPFVGNGDNRGRKNHRQQVDSRSEPQSSCAAMMAKIVSLPSCIVGGVSKAVGYGMTVAGDVLSHIGMGRRQPQRIQQQNPFLDPFTPYVQNDEPPVVPIQSEALAFVINFEQQYGHYHPSFVESNFMDALRRAKEEYKFLFVYLHFPDHPHTNIFCQNTLCSELVVQYLNATFVCWGATVSSSEGFHMSNALQATTFPFCALVTSASHENLAVLQQVEGPVPPEALVEILQRALEEQGSALMNERLKEEDGILSNRQLREGQDAAYQEALREDKERDQCTQLQSGHRLKKSEDKERKKPAGKEFPSEFYGEENATANGIQPTKGPNLTQILIRFPNGDRKEHRFLCTETVHSIYKYVDSLGLVSVGSYKLIATFPRREHSFEKMNLTLKEAGLHPQASLYLEERDQRTQLQSGHVSKKSEDKERWKPAEKELSSQFHGKENASGNGIQPDKGPNVTQILIRFPNGDRKERRFLCTDKVHSIYKYVDSLGLAGVGSYKLIATFPRREYGFEKMNLTLKEAGLHPQASLYLEVSNKQ